MTNAEIARVLREIAILLDMDSVPFRPRAYEKAAYAVEGADESLAALYRRGGIAASICAPSRAPTATLSRTFAQDGSRDNSTSRP